VSLQKERILVIGGMGFIGHHLVKRLCDMGSETIVFDKMVYEYKFPLYKYFVDERRRIIESTHSPLVTGDIRNSDDLESTIKRFHPTKIVFLAATASAAICNKSPMLGFSNNLQATQIILEILRMSKSINQLVFASSSMVYGHFQTESVSEDSPVEPLGIYGAAKLASEYFIKAYHNIYGIPYTIVRPSALYGPLCINRRVTQIFVENAIAKKPILIEGEGDDKLDFSYIDDVINGLILILTKKEALNQIYNLTFGKSRTIGELSNILLENFPNTQIQHIPWNKDKPKRGTLNIKKIKRELGFDPVNSLEIGYPKYIEWAREFFTTITK